MFLLERGPDQIFHEEYQELALAWLNLHRRGIDAASAKTTSRRLTSLRAYARWAHIEHGDLLEYSGPTPAKGQPHPLPEGIEGVRRLVQFANYDYHAAYVGLCGLAGLRSSEALVVTPDHINMHDMILLVKGKGDKERLVPISPELWEILCSPVTRSFCTNRGSIVGLKDRFARHIVTELGKRAGLARPISSHDLRATFATAVYRKTKDMRLVQQLLGHASVDTTQLYIEVAINQMREAVVL